MHEPLIYNTPSPITFDTMSCSFIAWQMWHPMEVSAQWKYSLISGSDFPMEMTIQWVWLPNGSNFQVEESNQWRQPLNGDDHPMKWPLRRGSTEYSKPSSSRPLFLSLQTSPIIQPAFVNSFLTHQSHINLSKHLHLAKFPVLSRVHTWRVCHHQSEANGNTDVFSALALPLTRC